MPCQFREHHTSDSGGLVLIGAGLGTVVLAALAADAAHAVTHAAPAIIRDAEDVLKAVIITAGASAAVALVVAVTWAVARYRRSRTPRDITPEPAPEPQPVPVLVPLPARMPGRPLLASAPAPAEAVRERTS